MTKDEYEDTLDMLSAIKLQLFIAKRVNADFLEAEIPFLNDGKPFEIKREQFDEIYTATCEEIAKIDKEYQAQNGKQQQGATSK